MTREQRFSIISITASSFAVWLYLVTQVQPNKSDMLIMTTFFLSLIVWLGSLIAFTIYTTRVKQSNREIIYAHIRPAVRQGFLMSGTIAMILFLKLLRVITFWDALLVVGMAFLFEIALRQSPGFRKS